MTMKKTLASLPIAAVLLLTGLSVGAQTGTSPATSATSASPRQSGTVKAVTATEFVLTTAAGQDYAVTVPASAHILLVDPATRDVKNAQPGAMSDVAAGDKAVVTGSAGDAGQMLTATRVLLLKSGAIAALHAQEQEAWAHSVGGVVKTATDASGALTVVNGSHTYTVQTSPKTMVRRYTGASVKFEDAVKSTTSAIEPGDQIQARGQHSADGSTVTADEIVAGSFSNFSGLLMATDPTAGTVTLKDLATKKIVTVAITPQTNLRKLPASSGAGAGGETAAHGASGRPQGERAGGGMQAPSGETRQGGAGRMDLARMLPHLPTETVADLKPGDAVMIVASNSGQAGNPTAITLLSGVERILASSPAGQTTLSPWSLGSSESESGGEGAGTGGR